MKNKMVIASACVLFAGCASLKYPNWEQVNIESSVHNNPCQFKWPQEQCFDNDCNSWFKKRATLYGANTVVKNGNSGEYFYCAPGISLYVDKKLFLGWDEKGHKIWNNANNANEVQQKLKNDRNATNSTILNEDTILCETDNLLVTTGDQLIKYATSSNYVTGSDLIDQANRSLKSIENYTYERRLSDIEQSTHDIGVYSYAERDRRDMAREQNQLSREAQSTKEIEELSKFLKSCTVNKEAQPVEVIENKPISKIAKIKVKLNNGFFELWTYDSHLTFKK